MQVVKHGCIGNAWMNGLPGINNIILGLVPAQYNHHSLHKNSMVPRTYHLPCIIITVLASTHAINQYLQTKQGAHTINIQPPNNFTQATNMVVKLA